MNKIIHYIGLDVHKESIAVSIALHTRLLQLRRELLSKFDGLLDRSFRFRAARRTGGK